MTGIGHNSDAFGVSADELQQLVEQIESLEAEKRQTADLIRDAYGEAKARGYDTKVMRKLIALRKRKPDAIAEEWAILETYGNALGMGNVFG